ncbi:MAG: bifunctional metallophosphatase/5'-nucleotidase [Prevotella sp.]|nr:bifunctional metallophosphatase/5'-nucleotidase [Prevotella sp.]
MRKLFISWLLVFTTLTSATAQTRDLHILSVNDMHATLGHMPMLAAIADSLRGIDKQTLVFSAGDNRTGDPVNDLYPIPSYPMTALMNLIGFDATALGNHEFDNGQKGLAQVISTSNFPYLCANLKASPEYRIQTEPYHIFVIDGIKIGVLGMVELGTKGLPDAHPDLLQGLSFTPVEETIRQYEWLRDKVDIYILLSHVGFEDDVALAEKFPYFDLIIGGHTHTQLKGGELHNGVLVTQNENKLKLATYITLNVENGKLVGKSAKNINIKSFPKKNEVAESMVEFFASNPEFKRVLTTAEEFDNLEQLGCLMCDALTETTGADIALQNGGGVRFSEKKAGPFTVNDVLRLDPFGNECIEMELTGEEFKKMYISCFTNDSHDPPFVSGVKCELVADTLTREAKDVRLYTLDGKKLNLKKKYRVVCNSYVAAICDAPRKDQGHSIGKRCSDLLIQFLDGHAPIDYRNVKRVTIVHSPGKR